MFRNHARRAILALGALTALAVPATASAYTVTVHVHGAGLVDEVTERNLMFCTVGPSGKGESSVTPCSAGSLTGHYSFGDIIQLRALVPADHFNKGWRFSHWQDSTAGGGKINCDDTGGAGQPAATDCRFQIFENLEVDLYFTDDAGPSDTVINGGPGENTRTNSTSASFTFNSPSESSDARYECRLDPPGAATGSYADCNSPDTKSASYPGLGDGQYTLFARAKDLSGNVDPNPASRTWTVDTVAPTASITGTPGHGAVTNSSSANLSASANEPGTLVCRFGPAPVPCNFNPTGLQDGTHTFTAQATDAAGNTSLVATRSWRVDTIAPVVSIEGNPAAGAVTTQTTAALTASSNEAGAVTCTFDGEPAPCTLERNGLADGEHTFSAATIDAAGNPGSATRTWTVDTTGPVITLTGGPAAGSATNETIAAFTWSAGEAVSAYECALDESDFEPCSSGKSYSSLSNGSHTFKVRGRDNLGNLGAEVERTWTVDSAVPDTTILKGPDEGSTTASPEATLEFASPESGATFECSLDGAAFASCTSPLKLTGVTNADHVFEVRARDAAGNVDASPARRAWRVNTLDADADGVNSPADCDDANPAVKPGATDIPGDGIDQDCAGGDATPPIDDDRDNDGVRAGVDCDDTNPAVRPGAQDLPKDGIDQDCKDGDAAFPITSGALNYNFKPAGKRTRILRMVLSRIAVGATVKITCKGRGCPLRSKSYKPSKGTLDVRKALRRKPLRAGNVLTLSITQPGHVAKVIRFQARRGKSPAPAAFRCLQPGATKLTACT